MKNFLSSKISQVREVGVLKTWERFPSFTMWLIMTAALSLMRSIPLFESINIFVQVCVIWMFRILSFSSSLFWLFVWHFSRSNITQFVCSKPKGSRKQSSRNKYYLLLLLPSYCISPTRKKGWFRQLNNDGNACWSKLISNFKAETELCA